MVRTLIAAFAVSSLAACASVPDQTQPQLTSSELIGTWDVSLYFSAEAPPSATVMEITDVGEDGALAGSFYQSAFESGRYTLSADTIIISVITSDGSGPYATSGRYTAEEGFKGQTLSTGRDFLMAWSAEKR